MAEVMEGEKGKGLGGREVDILQRPPGGGLGAAGRPREPVVGGGVGGGLGHRLGGGVGGRGERGVLVRGPGGQEAPGPSGPARPAGPWVEQAASAPAPSGTRKAREEGSGGRGWRGAVPRRKPRRKRREARAGRGAREPGRRPRPAQGSAARGLQVGAWEEDGLGQEAAPHVQLGPPRGGEAAAAGAAPAPRAPRPPRRGGDCGRTVHSRLFSARRPPLALWSFQSLLCRRRERC